MKRNVTPMNFFEVAALNFIFIIQLVERVDNSGSNRFSSRDVFQILAVYSYINQFLMYCSTV